MVRVRQLLQCDLMQKAFKQHYPRRSRVMMTFSELAVLALYEDVISFRFDNYSCKNARHAWSPSVS